LVARAAARRAPMISPPLAFYALVETVIGLGSPNLGILNRAVARRHP